MIVNITQFDLKIICNVPFKFKNSKTKIKKELFEITIKNSIKINKYRLINTPNT